MPSTATATASSVPDAVVGDALALEQRAHGLQPVALERRLLVVLLAGGEVHPPLEVALDLRGSGRRGSAIDAVDALAVLLLGDVADAGRPAALDVVVEARRARAPARLGALAGAEQEDLAEQVERPAHALGVRVRAEVGALAAVALAREVDAREVLVERDRDVRIRLVVAQPDVEARLVLLDEVLLGEQRLGLGLRRRAYSMWSICVEQLVGRTRRAGEVRGHALADRLRLADVDHAPARVAEQVDAGLVGQRPALLGQSLLRAESRPPPVQLRYATAAADLHAVRRNPGG